MADDIESQIDQMMAQNQGPQAQSPNQTAAPNPLEQQIDQQMQHDQAKDKALNNPGQMSRAVLEELGRGATLGLSDVVSRAAGVPAEELAARKEALEQKHPFAAPALEVAAGAVPLVLSGGLTAPAEGLVGAGLGADLLAGSAEGAAYGAGSAISDASLGDPNLNAQKVVSDIGMGSVLGLGGTAVFKGVSSLFGKSGGAMAGSVADAIDSEGSAAAKSSDRAADVLNNGDTSLIKNSDEIINAGKDLGIEPTNAMISSDEKKLIATDILMKGPPTAPAIRQKKLYGDIYNKLTDAAGSIAPEIDMSENEFGQVLQKDLASNINAEAAPYNDAYQALRDVNETIPVNQQSLNKIADNILDLRPVKIDSKASYSQFARDVAEEIQEGNLKTVDDLRDYQTRLGRRLNAFAAPEEKRVVGMIMDKLDGLEKNTIKRNTQDFISKVDMNNPAEASVWGDKVQQLSQHLQNMDELDKNYSSFRQKVNGLMDWLGKDKVTGPKDAISFIQNDLEPEDLVKNLWSKKYAGLPEYISENFPEQAAMIKSYQKSLLRKEATKDGVIDVKKFLDKFDKLTKEQKSFLFAQDEIKKINSMTTIMRRFPKAFNTSNTAHTSAWRAFFQDENGHFNMKPTELLGMAAANARDFAIERYINRSVGAKAITNRADEKMMENIKDIFNSNTEGGF